MFRSRASAAARVVVAVSLGAVSHAATPKDPWIRIRSNDFELFTTAGERGGIDLIRHFEQVHNFFQQAFALDGAAGHPVRVVSFRSDQEYRPYRPNDVADAYFQPGIEHDYIVMKDSTVDLYPMAIHEYTHLLLRQTRLEIPPWLNEGLAELYSSLESSSGKMIVGQVIPGRLRALAREPWIDLRALVSAGPTSPLYTQKGHAAMFYAESWALVHMLALDGRYSAKLGEMMSALKTGDSVGALQRVYGKPISKIQQDLKSYFSGHGLNAAVFDVRLQAEDAPTVETGASLAARLALAELLSNDRAKLDRALAAYNELSRDYGNRWEVEQGWAEFSARERRNQEALTHFTRAAGLGATDAGMYVKYAAALRIANRHADALEALRTAVKFNPTLDDAHFELAIALVRAEGYREALAEFHATRHLPQDQAFRYFYYLAEAHYHLGDLAQARLLIQKGRSQTHNPDELASFNRLQRLLDAR